MSKKKETRPQGFSSSQYFEEDSGYCPFKDIKLVPKKEPEKKAPAKPVNKVCKVDPRMYDMFGPSSTSIVRKNEDMPLELLLECSPQASLDLHGIRPEKNNIPQKVEEFLDESVEKGRKKVEIIVGKGNHSDGEPVIPGIVKSTLFASRVVRRFDYAPTNRGGEGSFWVILGERKKGERVVFSSSVDEKQNDIRGLEEARAKAKAKAQAQVKNISIDYDSYLPKDNDKR